MINFFCVSLCGLLPSAVQFFKTVSQPRAEDVLSFKRSVNNFKGCESKATYCGRFERDCFVAIAEFERRKMPSRTAFFAKLINKPSLIAESR